MTTIRVSPETLHSLKKLKRQMRAYSLNETLIELIDHADLEVINDCRWGLDKEEI